MSEDAIIAMDSSVTTEPEVPNVEPFPNMGAPSCMSLEKVSESCSCSSVSSSGSLSSLRPLDGEVPTEDSLRVELDDSCFVTHLSGERSVRADADLRGRVVLLVARPCAILGLSLDVRGSVATQVDRRDPVREQQALYSRTFVIPTSDDDLEPGAYSFPFDFPLQGVSPSPSPSPPDDPCTVAPISVPSFSYCAKGLFASAAFPCWSCCLLRRGDAAEAIMCSPAVLIPVSSSPAPFLSAALLRRQQVTREITGMFLSGSVSISASLPRALFYAGEAISLSLLLLNTSSLSIRSVSLSLHATLLVRPLNPRAGTTASHTDLLDHVQLLEVLANTGNQALPYVIPPGLKPSVASPLCDLSYRLTLRVLTDSLFSPSHDFDFPITITVPEIVTSKIVQHRIENYLSSGPTAFLERPRPVSLMAQQQKQHPHATTAPTSPAVKLAESGGSTPPRVKSTSQKVDAREVNAFLTPSHPHISVGGVRSATLFLHKPLRGSIPFGSSYLFHYDVAARNFHQSDRLTISAHSGNQKSFSIKAQYGTPPSAFSSHIKPRLIEDEQVIVLGPYTNPPLSAGTLFVQITGQSFFDNTHFVVLLDETAQDVPASPSDQATLSESNKLTDATVEEVVFQNERRISPFTPFEASNLFGDDPQQWTDSLGVGCCPPESIVLPFGWRWSSQPWKQSQWRYAFNFSVFFNGEVSYVEPSATTLVRRQTWSRRRTTRTVSSDSSGSDSELTDIIDDFEIMSESSSSKKAKPSSRASERAPSRPASAKPAFPQPARPASSLLAKSASSLPAQPTPLIKSSVPTKPASPLPVAEPPPPPPLQPAHLLMPKVDALFAAQKEQSDRIKSQCRHQILERRASVKAETDSLLSHHKTHELLAENTAAEITRSLSALEEKIHHLSLRSRKSSLADPKPTPHQGPPISSFHPSLESNAPLAVFEPVPSDEDEASGSSMEE